MMDNLNSQVEFFKNEVRGSLIRTFNLMKQQNLGQKVTMKKIEDMAKDYLFRKDQSTDFMRQTLYFEMQKLSKSIYDLSNFMPKDDFDRFMMDLFKNELKISPKEAEVILKNIKKAYKV